MGLSSARYYEVPFVEFMDESHSLLHDYRVRFGFCVIILVLLL